jgi:hypothetical protein
MLRHTFHWHSNQNNERLLAALEASLAATGAALDQAVPLIAALLELPRGDKYPPLSIPPKQQRKRLLAALVAWTIGFAKAQPLVLATEDLHWADPSTLEVTQLMVEQAATAPILLLYTARPEFRASWPMRAHHTQIALRSDSNCRGPICGPIETRILPSHPSPSVSYPRCPEFESPRRHQKSTRNWSLFVRKRCSIAVAEATAHGFSHGCRWD